MREIKLNPKKWNLVREAGSTGLIPDSIRHLIIDGYRVADPSEYRTQIEKELTDLAVRYDLHVILILTDRGIMIKAVRKLNNDIPAIVFSMNVGSPSYIGKQTVAANNQLVWSQLQGTLESGKLYVVEGVNLDSDKVYNVEEVEIEEEEATPTMIETAPKDFGLQLVDSTPYFTHYMPVNVEKVKNVAFPYTCTDITKPLRGYESNFLMAMDVAKEYEEVLPELARANHAAVLLISTDMGFIVQLLYKNNDTLDIMVHSYYGGATVIRRTNMLAYLEGKVELGKVYALRVEDIYGFVDRKETLDVNKDGISLKDLSRLLADKQSLFENAPF